jgi:hypothetical protein
MPSFGFLCHELNWRWSISSDEECHGESSALCFESLCQKEDPQVSGA